MDEFVGFCDRKNRQTNSFLSQFCDVFANKNAKKNPAPNIEKCAD